jgi:glycine betaine/proline transport system ATP-binding protein
MTTPEAKLVCRNVWKLFGSEAKEFLERHDGHPDEQAIAHAGLVGAVRQVDLDVRKGEIFVIMGLSGSGKSTLVRCLSRLIQPTAGQLIFDGEDILGKTDKQHHRDPPKAHGHGVSAFRVAASSQRARERGVSPRGPGGATGTKREARAREVIELVGLKGQARTISRRQLSGGQQQRVGIARSLVVEPEMWFLDEPFSALDPLIRREMQDEFMRLQAMLKKTIVFITHDFDEAIRLADRIAVMNYGKIVQVATPEELVLNPADDYVEEFTRNVARAKVIRTQSLMAAADAVTSNTPSGKPTVSARANIADAAPLFTDGITHLSVVDDQDRIIGRLDRDVVVDMMLKG